MAPPAQSVPGTFDDAALLRLDDLMAEVAERGLKLTVALHDRWSLGCWRVDAYAKAYRVPIVYPHCATDAGANDPTPFYTSSSARAAFKGRIAHVLGYRSRHHDGTIGSWVDALFSVEAQNEAFGHSSIPLSAADWLCEMSTEIRARVHPGVLVSSGGGGIGNATGAAELARAEALAGCAALDVVALHSYAGADRLDALLTGYRRAVGEKARLVVQEWGVVGATAEAKALAFTKQAAVIARHAVPGMYWGLAPWSTPVPPTSLEINPPGPPPTLGDAQRTWQTALYPAAQEAALAPAASQWPEIWGCGPTGRGLSPRCEMNGVCSTKGCLCRPGWRGPTCGALKLGPAPRGAGFREENSSSWGGSIVASGGQYHMFSSYILGGCGLNAWGVNSVIVRAVANTPTGPYRMQERVAGPFAHEPNLVQGRLPSGGVMLLGTLNEHPQQLINCSSRGAATALQLPPPKSTYLWRAASPELIAQSVPVLVVNSTLWDRDDRVHHTNHTAICDTNLAAAVLENGSLIGVWRRCETVDLHTMPHSLMATCPEDPSTFAPSIDPRTFRFLSHAGAEDPFVYVVAKVVHVIFHDEQITRCADRPVGCWPGGRHAWSTDGGATFTVSPLDAYNGTIVWEDGEVDMVYLRARPHLIVDQDSGRVTHLSNGIRPKRESDWVYTLVVPIEQE